MGCQTAKSPKKKLKKKRSRQTRVFFFVRLLPSRGLLPSALPGSSSSLVAAVRACCRGWCRGGGWVVSRRLGGVAAAGRLLGGVGARHGGSRALKAGKDEVFYLMNSRVGLGRVGPTPTADKNPRNPPFPPPRHDCHGYGGRHGAAIPNPQRHRYSVAFFRNSATENRHGAAMAAI
ncbi:hypothetical protein HKD37_03G008302 [Glycine soja]